MESFNGDFVPTPPEKQQPSATQSIGFSPATKQASAEFVPQPANEQPANYQAPNPAIDMAQHLSDVYGVSADQFSQDLQMYKALGGGITYEQVKEDFKPSISQTLRQQRIKDFDARVDSNIALKFGTNFMDTLAGAAPMLLETSEAGAVSAGTGAATGAVLGGEAGTFAIPFTAGVSVPAGATAGALAGAATGFGLGASGSAGMVMAGHMYGSLRDRGATHDQAVPWSIANGILQAVLMHKYLGTIGSSFTNAIGSTAAKLTTYGAIQTSAWLLSDLGMQGSLGSLMEMGNIGTEYVALHDIPGAKLPTWDEAISRTAQAFLSSMQVGAFTHAVGYSTGAVTNAMRVITNSAKGTKIQAGVSIDVANADYEARKAGDEYLATKQMHDSLSAAINEMKTNGTEVPQALQENFSQLNNELGKRQTAAAKAVEYRKSLTDFNNLEPDEQLKVAKDNFKDADHYLEIIQYKIADLEDQDLSVPQDLKDQRKQARIEKRIASDVVRQTELQIEKDKLLEKLTDATIKAPIQKAIDDIDAEVRKLIGGETLRKLATRKTELQGKLTEVQTKIDEKEQANRAEIKERVKNSKIVSDYGTMIRGHVSGEVRAQIEQQVNESNPTDKLKAREEKIQNDIETLDTISGLVNEDALSRSELERLNAKIPTGKVGRFAKKTFKITGQAVKETVKESRDDVSMANRLISLSGLSKKDQAKIGAFVPGMDLGKWLEKTEKRIDQLRGQAEQREATEYLDDALKASEPAVLGDRLNGLPEVQNLLDLIRLELDDETVKQLSADQKTDLADRILDLIDEGKAKKAKAIEDSKRELQAGIDKFVDAMTQGKPLEGTPYEQQNIITKQHRAGTDVHQMTWDAMIDMLLQRADHNATERRWMEVHKAIDAQKAGTNYWTDKFYDAITDGRKPKLVGLAVRSQKAKLRKGIPEVGKSVSDAKLMQILAWMDDPNLQGRLEQGNKFTAETRKKIEGMLSEDQLKMVERIKEFYKELYQEVNAVHRERFGYDLGKNKDYAGPAYAEAEKGIEESATDFMNQLFEQRSMIPGFTKISSRNTKPIKVESIFDNAQKYISDLERFKAWTEDGTYERINATLNDPRFKKESVHLFGEKTMKKVNEAFDDFTGVKPKTLAEIPFITEFTRSTGAIVANAMQLLKQPSGIFLYLSYLDPVTLWNNSWKIATEFDKYGPLFDSFDFIKARKMAKSKEIQERMGDTKKLFGDNPIRSGLRLAQHMQGQALHIADAFNVYFGGGALYLDALNKGMSEPEARDLMASVSRSTQGSAAADQRTPLERNTAGALLSQFTKPNVQAHFLAASDLRTAINKPTVVNWKQAIASSVAVRISEAAFVLAGSISSVISAGMLSHDGDDKNLERALRSLAANLTSALTMGPGAGTPLNAITATVYKTALNYVWNAQQKVWEINLPVFEMGNELAQLTGNIGAIATGVKEPTTELEFEMWREANRSIVMASTGLNLEEIRRMVKFAFDLSESPEDRKARRHEYAMARKEHKREQVQ